MCHFVSRCFVLCSSIVFQIVSLCFMLFCFRVFCFVVLCSFFRVCVCVCVCVCLCLFARDCLFDGWFGFVCVCVHVFNCVMLSVSVVNLCVCVCVCVLVDSYVGYLYMCWLVVFCVCIFVRQFAWLFVCVFVCCVVFCVFHAEICKFMFLHVSLCVCLFVPRAWDHGPLIRNPVQTPPNSATCHWALCLGGWSQPFCPWSAETAVFPD